MSATFMATVIESTLLAALVVPAKVWILVKLWCRFSRRWTPVMWFLSTRLELHYQSRNKAAFWPNSAVKIAIYLPWDRLSRVLSLLLLTSLPKCKNPAWDGKWLHFVDHDCPLARREFKWGPGAEATGAGAAARWRQNWSQKFFVVKFSPGIGWQAECMQPLLRHA